MLIGRGVQIDEHAATNIPGLYAAGDETGNFRSDIAGAAVMGRIAGESAAEYVKTTENTADVTALPAVQQAIEFYSSLMGAQKRRKLEGTQHGRAADHGRLRRHRPRALRKHALPPR